MLSILVEVGRFVHAAQATNPIQNIGLLVWMHFDYVILYRSLKFAGAYLTIPSYSWVAFGSHFGHNAKLLSKLGLAYSLLLALASLVAGAGEKA